MKVLAIDPGNEQSAWVLYDGSRPLVFEKGPNDTVLRLVESGFAYERDRTCPEPDVLAIEMIASYGMPVGREVFETCVWIGRFLEAWRHNRDATACEGDHALVYRKDVKLHLCGQPRAKDANIRQALLDRWGGKERAIGKKATPGPLYGISADVWSALAIAVTYADTTARRAA